MIVRTIFKGRNDSLVIASDGQHEIGVCLGYLPAVSKAIDRDPGYLVCLRKYDPKMSFRNTILEKGEHQVGTMSCHVGDGQVTINGITIYAHKPDTIPGVEISLTGGLSSLPVHYEIHKDEHRHPVESTQTSMIFDLLGWPAKINQAMAILDLVPDCIKSLSSVCSGHMAIAAAMTKRTVNWLGFESMNSEYEYIVGCLEDQYDNNAAGMLQTCFSESVDEPTSRAIFSGMRKACGSGHRVHINDSRTWAMNHLSMFGPKALYLEHGIPLDEVDLNPLVQQSDMILCLGQPCPTPTHLPFHRTLSVEGIIDGHCQATALYVDSKTPIVLVNRPNELVVQHSGGPSRKEAQEMLKSLQVRLDNLRASLDSTSQE